MLSKTKQKEYLRKKNGEWQLHLHAFAGSRDPEALHQLRVSLKKLKAVARFSKACAGTKALKDFDQLNKMFRQAGLIRDAGKTQQQQLEAAETEKFLRKIEQYRRNGKRAGRRVIADVRSVTSDSIRDWYAIQLITTGILLTGSSDELHKARKQIKSLLYVEKLLPPPIRESLSLDRKYLDDLQEAIGQWHDAAMMVAAWAGKDHKDSEAMTHDCREKETAVRHLAADFYLHAHC
ncbi:CHAD domain-containing protein [Puia sp.]|uniref:CHAD domain-containing protein n=1 Tax=Puia sp. TaxID=2045100 RepID=UPI002F3F7F28